MILRVFGVRRVAVVSVVTTVEVIVDVFKCGFVLVCIVVVVVVVFTVVEEKFVALHRLQRNASKDPHDGA